MENKIDWVSVMLYSVILIFGWLNIYAACYDKSHAAVFDFSTKHGKQLIWIGISVGIALFITLTDPRIFSSTAYFIYLFVLVLLVVTLFVGKVTKGGLSWIDFGPFKFQPSEFAKFATALVLAKYMSSLDLDYKQLRTKIMAWTLILIPVALILLQHDTGSALVFASFLLPLYREGLSARILVAGLVAVVLFVLALLVNKFILVALLAAIGLFYLFVWLNKRTRKHYTWTIALFLAASLFTFSVDYVFEHEYMIGLANNWFGASDDLTRAQLVQILYKIAGAPVIHEYDIIHRPYVDVEKDAWYYDAVTWARVEQIALGVVTNNGCYFEPDSEATRADLALMIEHIRRHVDAGGAGIDTVEQKGGAVVVGKAVVGVIVERHDGLVLAVREIAL